MKANAMQKLVAAGAVIAAFGLASAAQAHDLLGQREVAYLSERDDIVVHQDRPYREIRVCVSKHAVRFRDLDVRYRNGRQQDLRIGRLIPAGECSRWIDLDGGERWLSRIILRYDTYGNFGPRAVVKVYGR